MGGRVLVINKNLSTSELNNIIARLKKVPGVLEVEEDAKYSEDIADTINPKQWNMEAQTDFKGGLDFFIIGKTRFFGNSFFLNNTFVKHNGKGMGEGITVAVLDTGYTPHPNFMSNLQPLNSHNQYGYTFLSDCRDADTCLASTKTEDAHIMPVPDAIDSGNHLSQEDYDASNGYFLKQNIGYASDFHGTSVIGVIIGQHIAIDSNAGAASASRVVPVRVLGKGTAKTGGYTSDLVAGMLWAAGLDTNIINPNPAKVINMSLSNSSRTCPSLMQSTIDMLVANNVTVVVTAGNTSETFKNRTPANCDGVIVVSALDSQGYLASYSNGGNVTIAAAGGDPSPNGKDALGILTTKYMSSRGYATKAVGCSGIECFGYRQMNGTSMAAPLVTSAVADMLSVNPNLTPAQIKKIIQDSGSEIPNKDPIWGSNRKCNKSICLDNSVKMLNAADAINMAATYNK